MNSTNCETLHYLIYLSPSELSSNPHYMISGTVTLPPPVEVKYLVFELLYGANLVQIRERTSCL
jgi:hypothetical protein